MYCKIKISGYLELVTGMHIGTSGAFSAIGAVDSPIARDPLDKLPIIPGSSLKGKMRTLLAKKYNQHLVKLPDNDDERIRRIFGSTVKNSEYRVGRLLFSDMLLANEEELRDLGASGLTEIKFENTINRLSSEANPRQIERAIRGSKFILDLLYEFCPPESEDGLLEDFKLITDGIRLLQYDYLGGHGSRGYGRIRFSNLAADVVIGELESGVHEQINEMLAEANDSYGG